mgnify:FL=1
MKNKPLIISLISLVLTIILAMNYKSTPVINVAAVNSNLETKLKDKIKIETQSTNEMRAVWVSFMSLNMSGSDYSEVEFKKKFDNIIDESKKHNINTLVVHVRPFNDSLYPSNYFPWSNIISGEQGKSPGFDPLDYMITATHNAKMQFHAWVNPMRIQINNTPNVLCESNIYNVLKNDSNNPVDIIMETDTGKYLNPGYSKIRKIIIDGVKEIVEKYPVDGIQFDDYFYPNDNCELDKICYNNYCSCSGNECPLSQIQWRLANINNLISGTYNAIKSIKPNVSFGISPQCNVDNDLKVGADVFTWCKTPGYIDYICPQTYVSLEHPLLPFSKSMKQWKDIIKCKDIKLYFGLAMYKAGSDADNGTWKNHDNILKTQVEQCRQIGCDGFMLFSFEDFKNEKAYGEIQNVMSVLN